MTTTTTQAVPTPVNHVAAWPAVVLALVATAVTLSSTTSEYGTVLAVSVPALCVSVAAVVVSAVRRSLLTVGVSSAACALCALSTLVGVTSMISTSGLV